MRLQFVLTAIMGLTTSLDLSASSLCAKVVDIVELPLSNAVINVFGLDDPNNHFSAFTDPKGSVCISKLPDGLYAVEASLQGFLNVRYYPVRVTFPDDVNLTFRLPFGEIREGGLRQDAVLTGTLGDRAHPESDLRICLFPVGQFVPAACSATNDLGQYALLVPPGKYRVEFTKRQQTLSGTTLDLPSPGYYRNRVALPGTPK
ncbi:MAG: carboxypeptidase regulatory-like domain-containing protein [Bryobacterales bacterium]|nr:carboxypeptidase regulatory-like domain-containing protein [Bryobacterales bacterium]